jgi:hypothetical protein
MRGGVLPPALLFIALGLALGFAPRRARLPSVLALLMTLAAFTLVPAAPGLADAVFAGCWISVIATAASVHLKRGLPLWAAVAFSVNVGVWAGAVVSVSGSQLDLLKALPCVSILLPASLLVARHASIPVKVASSWVIAIAALAATLQLLPVTPGYLPDHLE